MSSSTDDDKSDKDEYEYIFSTPEGHNLAHRVFQPQLPYDPHDAQLKRICKVIDRVDIMVLTPTGSGKTGYFTMYMLLMLRYQEIGSIENMGLAPWVWVFQGMPPDSIDQLMLCDKV
jgi:hypothetical protein